MKLNVRLRVALVVFFACAPVLFLLGMGVYSLWERGWSFIAWWPMALSLLIAYGLGWYWTRPGKSAVLPAVTVEPMGYWTERDKTAWALVEERVKKQTRMTAEIATDSTIYAKDAHELALTVARVYVPDCVNPYGHLTIPEVLTCAELVAEDLSLLVEKYLPGSHVIRIQDFGKVQQATDWYKRARGVYWLASGVVNPLKTALQVAATKLGLSTPWQMMQQNVLHWFYTSFLRELGRYLIELNSGRLKVGAKKYRELLAANIEPPVGATPQAIRVAVVGPAGAGKQSLINALTVTDEMKAAFQFNKTEGYGVNGPGESEIEAAVTAALSADLVLLTMPARSAARAAEVKLLEGLKTRFAQTPQYKVPPLMVVLTHVDMLTPAAEWAPPYDWAKGDRTKEKTAREAMAAVREDLGEGLAAVVPVCVSTGKLSGVNPELIQTLAGLVDDARAVNLLKAFHAETPQEQAKKVVNQVVNAGREAARVIWDQLKK